jgi:hypothetical protein
MLSLAVSATGRGPNQTQADALNEDINVIAICDLQTPLNSSPSSLPCLSYFDFHEAMRFFLRNEGTERKWQGEWNLFS